MQLSNSTLFFKYINSVIINKYFHLLMSVLSAKQMKEKSMKKSMQSLEFVYHYNHLHMLKRLLTQTRACYFFLSGLIFMLNLQNTEVYSCRYICYNTIIRNEHFVSILFWQHMAKLTQYKITKLLLIIAFNIMAHGISLLLAIALAGS